MLDQATWVPVVTAAVQDYLDSKNGGRAMAIPAAPLKPLVIRRAEETGLSFPPDGYENRKFVEFLDAVSTAITTRRRPGQDVLVALAGQENLLDQAVSAQTEPSGKGRTLRSDLFRAFTQIPSPNHQHWYSRDGDSFSELPVDQANPTLIAIRNMTLEAALEDRSSFAESLVEESERNLLLQALRNPPVALGEFRRTVKELHLERAWHVFRLGRLTAKITAWALDNRIEWQASWNGSEASNDAVTVSSRETNSFLAGLMQLGPDDAKRVLVPLDIVLKLIRRD